MNHSSSSEILFVYKAAGNLNLIVLNKVGKYSTFSGKYAAAHCNIFVLLLAIKQDQKVCALAAFAFSVCNLNQYLVYVRLRKKRNVKIMFSFLKIIFSIMRSVKKVKQPFLAT